MTTDSVISRQRAPGSIPLPAMAARTVSTKAGSASWRAVTLTFTLNPVPSGADCAQVAPCRQASWSTREPIDTIRSDFSASGMKPAGDRRPRSGWRQRTSASQPERRPVASS